MSTPTTWAETLERLGRVVGEPEAAEWLRECLAATWGAQDVIGLNRPARRLALQRMIGTTLRLEEGFYPFTRTVRADVAAAFAFHWGGLALEGPPWRLDPGETDRPLHAEWAALANFASRSV